MYGDFNPYADNAVNLGKAGVAWQNVYAKKLTVGSTSITESQLQGLLKLI